MRKLRGRMMPPPGRPRPDEATYDSIVSYLETALDRSAAAQPNPGRVDTFRRLNRTEYQNAVRDLLALDVDVSSLLPKDDVSHGFDNVGVGGLSPTLLERYLAAAQKVSRLAVGSPMPSPASYVVVLPTDLTQEDHVDGLPFGTRGGALVRHNFPLDGAYEIQSSIVAGSQRKRRGTHRTAPAGSDAGRQARTALHDPAEPEPERRLLRGRGGRQRPENPRAGAGGSARSRRDVPAKDVRRAGDRAPALQGALQHGPASAHSAGRALGFAHRPV